MSKKKPEKPKKRWKSMKPRPPDSNILPPPPPVPLPPPPPPPPPPEPEPLILAESLPTYRYGMTAEGIRDLVGESPVMLEIGSHEGIDTTKFLAAMPGIRLYCFDPEERANAIFRKKFRGEPRVTLYEMAVADIDGERPFYASTGKAGGRDDWTYSGGLTEPTGHLIRSPEIKFREPVPVLCIRLDTWLELNSRIICKGVTTLVRTIDFAWVDIQGAQRLFIAGAREALTKIRYLYIECYPVPQYAGEPLRDELIAMLPGFTPLGIYGNEDIMFESRTLT